MARKGFSGMSCTVMQSELEEDGGRTKKSKKRYVLWKTRVKSLYSIINAMNRLSVSKLMILPSIFSREKNNPG